MGKRQRDNSLDDFIVDDLEEEVKEIKKTRIVAKKSSRTQKKSLKGTQKRTQQRTQKRTQQRTQKRTQERTQERTQKKLREKEPEKELTTFAEEPVCDYIIDYTWNSATTVHNYLLNDPILDYFKYRNERFSEIIPEIAPEIISDEEELLREAINTQIVDQAVDPTDPEINETMDVTAVPSKLSDDVIIGGNVNNFEEVFFKFITNKGVEFENSVMTYLRTKNIPIKQVCYNRSDILLKSKFEETKIYMKLGVPIIYQGALHDPSTKTYGSPDLIVRSDYVHKLVNNPPEMEEGIYYVIIDIKFCNLKLRADGIHLLNIGRMKSNKGQIMIYNRIIGKIQNYVPRYCYVMGRGYTFTKSNVTFSSILCSDRLGHIDTQEIDKDYDEEIDKALKWVSDVKSNSKNWSVNPPSRQELYPNMCNNYDIPYHKLKEDIAEEIKEITLLWNVGVVNRNKAHSEGITKWSDPRLTTEILGFKKGVKSRIIQKMIDFNGELETSSSLVIPKIINNNFYNWKTKPKIEFFIDFETVNNMVDDLTKIPSIGTQMYVFMIGLYCVISGSEDSEGSEGSDEGLEDSKEYSYYNFTASELSPKGEEEIFEQLQNTINDIQQKLFQNSSNHDIPDANFYHWGHVEKSIYEKILLKYPLLTLGPEINFCDVCEIFKDEPILIKGVFDFSLKSIAKSLIKYGLIDNENNYDKCSSGLEAMIVADKCYNNLRNNPAKTITDYDEIQKIIDYNKTDCVIIYKIISYLRKNHQESQQELNQETQEKNKEEHHEPVL